MTERFHPSEFIAEELEARGWDRWTLAHRMGGDPAHNRLVLDLYFEVGPGELGMLLGEQTARQLGEAFGVSPQFFLNLETAWRAVRANWCVTTGRKAMCSPPSRRRATSPGIWRR